MEAGTGRGENLARAPRQMTHEKTKKKKKTKRMRMQVQAQVQAQQQPPERP